MGRASRRQADRIVLLAGPETPLAGPATGCDLVLLAPMPNGRTAAWLEKTEPAAHHLVYEAAYDLGAARVARRIAGRSLGLVLSGGGARGFAHIGAIAAIAEAGHRIDRLGGCSMGAFIAAMAALGLEPDQIRDRCHEELVRKTPFNDWTVPRVALIRSRKAGRMLERVFGEPPGRGAAAPALHGQRRPPPEPDRRPSPRAADRGGRGEHVDPGLAPPLARGGKLLVDGGVLSQPARRPDGRQPRRAGDRDRRGPPARGSRTSPGDAAAALDHGDDDAGDGARQRRARGAQPVARGAGDLADVQDVGLREFGALDRAVAGRAAAEAALADAESLDAKL